MGIYSGVVLYDGTVQTDAKGVCIELLVYFHRSVEHLQTNIARRGREYEKNISDAYLTKVQNSYFEYFRNILSYPILIIDLNTIDFEENDRNYQEVKMLLAKKYNPGVHRISLMV